MVVLKEDSLKNLQEDIKDTENKSRHSIKTTDKRNNGKTNVERNYEWITEPLSHGAYPVYWLTCTETITGKDKNGKQTTPVATRFVYLAGLEVDKSNVRNLAQAGRMRWKIENEGFNTQKHGGYELEHKYYRSTFACFKNYYQCLQIAHMINQLAEQSKYIADMLATNKKLTIKHLWKDLLYQTAIKMYFSTS